jgi:hypothetical protein
MRGTSVIKAPLIMMARHTLGTITHVITDQSVAALTFDDGPDPHYTPLVLKVLAKHHAKATFFMVGERVLQYPDLVKQVVSEGHSIANHTWSHRSIDIGSYGNVSRSSPSMRTPRSFDRRMDIKTSHHDGWRVGWDMR